MEKIFIEENGLYATIGITKELDVRLLHFSNEPWLEENLFDEIIQKEQRLVEIQITGENQLIHHGTKHTGTVPGHRLQFQKYEDLRNKKGRLVEFHLIDPIKKLTIKVVWQFFDGIPVIRAWTEVENNGEDSVGLEYVSSFALSNFDYQGLKNREDKIKLHLPHSAWSNEVVWKKYGLAELGLYADEKESSKRIFFSNTGTWSSSQLVPTGLIENTEAGTILGWQIETQGSWHWEIGAVKEQIYLQLGGPNEQDNHWWKELKPKESFVTIPVAVSFTSGSLTDAVHALTKYRRAIRRVNKDNIDLPIIFNDYMNCLNGDPTTEKLIPLIDAASEVGCEYFCIDCGWYSAGYWWDGVGEWIPSKERFPNGITEVTSYIKEKGMIPGLWLEIEVMGVNCPLADKVPKEWFFTRHGKRIVDRNRYQLDFRNKEVQNFATSIIDRLVNEYGVGYIKMDYNINAGIGTEINSDSMGDGLLEHNRAYLSWLDSIFSKYPNLVIENCGSGGMREDYALLSRHSIQSTSDQTDYLRNGVIAAASASVITPEQAAVWNYPLESGDEEEVVFNMVNSMLLRIHQSGHLAELSEERLLLVKEGLSKYKELRKHIRDGLPIWPTGFPHFEDDWFSFGIVDKKTTLLGVWRVESVHNNFSLSISHLKGKKVNVTQLYPSFNPIDFTWNKETGILTVKFKKNKVARLLKLEEL